MQTNTPALTCADCHHYNKTGLQEGMCLRYPPKPLVVPSPQGIAITAVYPGLRPDCRACGEFKQRAAILTDNA